MPGVSHILSTPLWCPPTSSVRVAGSVLDLSMVLHGDFTILLRVLEFRSGWQDSETSIRALDSKILMRPKYY